MLPVRSEDDCVRLTEQRKNRNLNIPLLCGVTLEGDYDTFDPCSKQDFFYDRYAKHTMGLLKRVSVFYSARCEVILSLQSYCYIFVVMTTAKIT